MLILCTIRGLTEQRSKHWTLRRPFQILIDLATPMLDGLATVGGVFASLEGGHAMAVWLGIGAAALAGFYTLPLRNASFLQDKFKCLSGRGGQILFQYGKLITAAVAIAGSSYAAVMLAKQKSATNPDAYMWLLLTLGPALNLVVPVDRPKKTKIKFDGKLSSSTSITFNPSYQSYL